MASSLTNGRVVGLTAEEIGLTLNEVEDLLRELARLVLQTQMEEFITCAGRGKSLLRQDHR